MTADYAGASEPALSLGSSSLDSDDCTYGSVTLVLAIPSSATAHNLSVLPAN